jgi:hypothetical protein
VPGTSPQAAGRTLMRWELFLDQGRAYRLAQLVVQRHAATVDRLNAADIGRAAVSVVRNPEDWAAWGTQPEVLIHLKISG